MNTIFKISLIPVILFLLKFYPVAAQTPFKSLNYLYSISGTKTVAGIHNREPNSNPDLWTDSITVLTGKTPGLWSGDFLFSKTDVDERWKMIYEAEEAWNKGSLINLMWHTCSPAHSEPCRWNDQGVLDKLTDEEWVVMREHPIAGVKILGNNPFYEVAREISAGHHENFDGTGYPNKLKSEEIPLSARIVKLADVFDALTTKRPYKEPWSMEDALENIELNSIGMFDPKLVAVFKELFEDGTLVRIQTTYSN